MRLGHRNGDKNSDVDDARSRSQLADVVVTIVSWKRSYFKWALHIDNGSALVIELDSIE